ncbi:hypothetical protein MNBD_GAMMA06-2149 [hydrothermal vent metagenome]|uniref:Regulatory protein, RpfE type n=1 Tax=hydrothermal vent metagenome TaxID=652676 RepID=A0A3B0WAE5_9ZZZZ
MHSELHIIIPGICGPLAETQSLQSSSVIDNWVKKLSKSSVLPFSGNVNHVLTSLFNLNIKTDFPSAAFTLLANDMYDSDAFYMHAEPVYLRADMNQAILTTSNDLNISDSESMILCDSLNEHFNQDGLTFFILNKNQWFVSSKNKITLNTTSLLDAAGRNINFILPKGEDAVYWKQVLTEAQMLMHLHEINTTREDAGIMSINSLWFHGSGELSASEDNHIASFCGNVDMLKGLANHLQCEYLKTPNSVNEYRDYLLSCKQGSMNVLCIPELEHLVNYTDVNPWLKQLSNILDCWMYPLIKFSRQHNIKVVLYPCNGNKYQFSKYDNLKFWRKRNLEQYVSCY